MRLLAHAALSLLLAQSLPAVTIISVTDSDPDLPGNGNIVSNTALAMSWQQSQGFNNVTVSAAIGANLPIGSGEPVITAFLTTQVGAGTTLATHQVATASVNVPLSGDPHPLLTIFSGLTLGPGTYFLSVFHSSGGSPDWNFEPSATVTSDVGATAAGLYRALSPFDGVYLPASTFSLLTSGSGFFTVTGDVDNAVPEPSTFALIGIGIAAVAFRRYRA